MAGAGLSAAPVYATPTCNSADMPAGAGTSGDPYRVATADQLCNVRADLAAHYQQTADISLTSYLNWTPIGDAATAFSGTYDGGGFSVTDLTIADPTATGYQGLFGSASDTSALANISVAGVVEGAGSFNALLVGYTTGSVSNSTSAGSVVGAAGSSTNGGLIGYTGGGSVTGSRSSATVSGEGTNVGGLIGQADNVSINTSSASGDVTSMDAGGQVGGLVGFVGDGSAGPIAIDRTFATGEVAGDNRVGGLIGYAQAPSSNVTVSNSYAQGHVTGNYESGGLIGSFEASDGSSLVLNSYARGEVSPGDGTSNGGLSGGSFAPIPDTPNYWDTETSGQTTSTIGTGKTSDQMKTQATYGAWNFSTIWGICAGFNSGYPFLWAFQTTDPCGTSPVITSITPAVGPVAGGTSVTITWVGFTDATGVTFGGAPATITASSDTSVVVTTPAHATGSVDVVVTHAGGSVTGIDGFAYTPTVTSVAPPKGPLAGGSSVTITGTGFSGASEVTFGGAPAAEFAVVNDETITATTPAQFSGAVNVEVTANGTTGTLLDGFTYVPEVLSILPTAGPWRGGTPVTITGTGFTDATGVTFGNAGQSPAAATNVVVENDETITANAPMHAAGAVDVIVAVPGATGSFVNGYTYEGSTVTGMSPTTGQTSGGQPVSFTGTGLTGASVSFGGISVGANAGSTDTHLVVTTPAHAAGNVAVIVSTPGTDTTVPGGFTYVAAPTITTLSPASGRLSGGTTVTITGTGLTGTSGVRFAGISATNVTVVNDTTVTAVTPAHAAGVVDVDLLTPGGLGVKASGFTYAPAPTVTLVSPGSGGVGGGTSVTITGTNLIGTTVVTFGNDAATSVTVVDATTVTAVTPAHAAGSVDVAVTTPSGTNHKDDAFTYVAAPTVTAVSPPTGVIAGGTAVTITGTGFVDGAEVSIGGVAATGVTWVNATTLTATTGAHAVGAVNVVVTNPDNQVGTLTNGFTYVAVPTVPQNFQVAGAGAGSAAVSWTAPSSNGGTSITQYAAAAYAGPSGGVVVKSCITTGALGCTITGLTPGVTYYFTVRAKNAVGWGPLTTPRTAFRAPYAAPTVAGLSPPSGSIAGGTAVTITGTGFINGARVTIGGVAATGVTWVNATTLTATTGAHAQGAVNVVVTNPDDQGGTRTNGFTYVTVPTVPQEFEADGAGAGSAAVSWTAPSSNGGTPITQYAAAAYAGPSGGVVVKSCITTGALGCTITGLTPGVTYYFTVRAKNAVGWGPLTTPRTALAVP